MLSDAVSISWELFGGIPEDLAQYYGVDIFYGVGDNLTKAGTVKYDGDQKFDIENLKPFTNYQIKVRPFRKFGTKKDYGNAYPVVRQETDCEGN